MNLILFALAPVAIILTYVYFRDKYEKEPLSLLLKSLLAGAVIVLPVILMETIIGKMNPFYGDPLKGAWSAFAVAGFSEELFKFLALYILIWKNPNFNEKFDGIVYAVFVSLGFAAVENIMYVMQSGADVALTRAWTAVPAHAIFGITMGYYFGIAHMYSELKKSYLIKAFIFPFLLHGIYDFILMAGIPWLFTLFIPFVIYLYYSGLKRMKMISNASIFRDDEDD